MARVAQPSSSDAGAGLDRPPHVARPPMAPQALEPAEVMPITALPRFATGIVAGVRVPSPAAGAVVDPALERMALRLIEIGFVQGERLRVMAFGQPGSDPIAVRVGGRGGSSTFALRRQEAACVWVWPDSPTAR